MPRHFFSVCNLHPLLILRFLYLQSVSAMGVNYTIDDQFGDPRTGQNVTYQPDTLWQTQNCSGCAILPDVSQMMNETYHASTWNPGKPGVTLTIEFSGTAIYVFFTLIDTPSQFRPDITTVTAVNFILDQAPPVHFQYTPKWGSKYLYQFLVFARDHLPKRKHTLVIAGDPGALNQSYYINFDYAIYTYEFDQQNAGLSSTTTSSVFQSESYVGASHSVVSSAEMSTPPQETTVQTITITATAGLPLAIAPSSPLASAAPVALSDPSQSTRVKGGLISGLVLGGLAFLGGVVLLTRYILRQHKFRKHQEKTREAVRFYSEKLVRRVDPVN